MAEIQFHAQAKQTNRPDERRGEFQKRKLETAILRIRGSGREFTGLVPEDAGINKRIETIVKQNGGKIKKRYHEEMSTWEITEIRIGDQLLTKNSEVGIHWGIDGGKIPIMVDKNNKIRGFLNGEEVKSKEISVWSECSTADPKSIEELQGNRREVAGAHVASREKDPDLKNSEIILFDRETGELTPFSEHNGAESFDWDIKMEKLLMPQTLPTEKHYSHKMFDGFSPEMSGGGFYHTYIEIMDSKESLTDRITVIPLARPEFDGYPTRNAESVAQECPERCAGETFFHDHKTDIRPSTDTRPMEFTSEQASAQKVVSKEMPYNCVIIKRKSNGEVKTRPFGIKSECQEKREMAFYRHHPKMDKPYLVERLKILPAAVEVITVERKPVKNQKHGKREAFITEKKKKSKKKKKKMGPRIDAEIRKLKMKIKNILKNKKQKKKKKADNKIPVPEIGKKERTGKTAKLKTKHEIAKRGKKPKKELGTARRKTKKKTKALYINSEKKREFKNFGKRTGKKSERARRLRKLLERKKKKIKKYLVTGYF